MVPVFLRLGGLTQQNLSAWKMRASCMHNFMAFCIRDISIQRFRYQRQFFLQAVPRGYRHKTVLQCNFCMGFSPLHLPVSFQLLYKCTDSKIRGQTAPRTRSELGATLHGGATEFLELHSRLSSPLKEVIFFMSHIALEAKWLLLSFKRHSDLITDNCCSRRLAFYIPRICCLSSHTAQRAGAVSTIDVLPAQNPPVSYVPPAVTFPCSDGK